MKQWIDILTGRVRRIERRPWPLIPRPPCTPEPPKDPAPPLPAEPGCVGPVAPLPLPKRRDSERSE